MSRYSDAELVLNSDGSVYHLNLKPGDIAETIILVGDPGRVHRVSRHFDDIRFEMNKREFITHTGSFNGKDISVLSTGMGSDNIEIVMTELDALFNIDLKNKAPLENLTQLNLIRIGTSGGIQQDIKVGTHLAVDYAIGMGTLMDFYHLEQDEFEQDLSGKIKALLDLNFLPYCVRGSLPLNEIFAHDMPVGNTITAPGFYAPQGRQIRIAPKSQRLLTNLMNFHSSDFWLTNFEMETAALYGMAKIFGHKAISLNAILANRITNTFSKNPNKIIDELIKKVLDRFSKS